MVLTRCREGKCGLGPPGPARYDAPSEAALNKQSLSTLLIVGGQWGDEGKGKVVDLLAGGFNAVVRYNGGHNAGHTVRFAERHFALHLVPSGIVHERSRCYMAAGMVVDPTALVTEIDHLAEGGVEIGDRLMLSPRTTILLPTHRALDLAREGARGVTAIGTTGRGIGPAYQDLAQRRALRAEALTDPERFAAAARAIMSDHNDELAVMFGAELVDLDAAVAELTAAARRLGPMVGDVGAALLERHRRGETILFEGAQGVLLDILHGTYPYVTSSSCLPGFAATSCGVSVRLLGPVVGVMKAYVTRVGGGPFPSELTGPEGEQLRERGNEYGTTTGRPRRCGWFDAVAGRYAVQVAGLDAVALMKLDVLDGLDTIRVVTGYQLPDGGTLKTLPSDLELLARVTPVTVELPGWSSPTVGLTDEAALPGAARTYLEFLEQCLGVPIVLVSTGPRREETMLRGDSPLTGQLADRIAGSVTSP